MRTSFIAFTVFVSYTWAQQAPVGRPFSAADWPTPLAIPQTPRPHWQLGSFSSFPPSEEPDVRDCTNPWQWALTFDDGPSTQATPALLQGLRERSIRATFFITGSQAVQNPATLQQIYNDGHELAIHTWSHTSLRAMSIPNLVNEILYTAELVFNVTGFLPTLVRPPYGEIDSNVRGAIRGLGMIPVMWSEDTNDWRRPSAEQFVTTFQGFVSRRTNGSGLITLQHDLFPDVVTNGLAGIDSVRTGSRYTFTTVGACLNYQVGTNATAFRIFGMA